MAGVLKDLLRHHSIPPPKDFRLLGREGQRVIFYKSMRVTKTSFQVTTAGPLASPSVTRGSPQGPAPAKGLICALPGGGDRAGADGSSRAQGAGGLESVAARVEGGHVESKRSMKPAPKFRQHTVLVKESGPESRGKQARSLCGREVWLLGWGPHGPVDGPRDMERFLMCSEAVPRCLQSVGRVDQKATKLLPS